MITVKGQEYIKPAGETDWKLNKSVLPQTQDPVFNGRVVGAKKTIILHYNLPN